MARHRRIDPLCSFVQNPTNSGNVPLSGQPTQSEVVPFDLMNEQCRLATFRNWPNAYVTPQSLAKAGFYYFNQSDRVTCAWCHGVIAKWEVGDNPFTEHQKFFPNCPRAQLGPNIEIASDGIQNLGIQPIRTPKREKFSCLDARIRTFSRWPRSDIQLPEVLATAGFFYQEIDDQVRCFHCNGGLRSWQREDDPWFEHAQWFPNCQFVQLVKGHQYIANVQSQCRPSLDEAMSSDMVQKALQMGLQEGRVRVVVRNRLETCGRSFPSLEQLVDAVLDSQHVENYESAIDEESSQNSSTIVREVSRILETIFNPRASSSSSMQDNDDPPAQDIDHSDDEVVDEVAEEASVNATASKSQQMQTEGNNVPENSEVSRQNMAEVAEPANAHCSQISLEEENRKLKDARLCKVCMADEVGVVFLPCGHLGKNSMILYVLFQF